MALTSKGFMTVVAINHTTVIVSLNYQVFKIAYCCYLSMEDLEQAVEVCEGFVKAVKAYDPHLLNRPKFHLLLHLPQSIKEFGRTASFSSER